MRISSNFAAWAAFAGLVLLGLGSCGPEPASPAAKMAPTQATKQSWVQSLNELGVNKYLGTIHPVSDSTDGDWTVYHYDVTAGAACLHGTEYLVSERRVEASDDLVLFLQGGGACWNDATCSGLPLAKKEADTPGNPNGIFDQDNERNPLRNWNFVFASYCDGSVFSGDHIVDYNGVETRHWGMRNLSAAVTLMQKHYPQPHRILVTGSSAGGFGTLTAMGVVRAAYPDTPLFVLNDSGPGLENPALADGMGEEIREHWQFRQFMPKDCAPCDSQQIRLLDYALDRDPDLQIALFSYRYDLVIGSIFLGFYWDYALELQQITDLINERHPDRFKRLFIEGAGHTILSSKNFFSLLGYDFATADWVDGFVNNGSVWKDFR